ncbi:hypothetical protein [Streptomyces odontomachi]|uniref:hypothetical protein n=1 Tax=Streptomyces odontomachi TaxID=2944940 RepID=UPI00210D899E|nr:hypothetical protein [Streptomyces sp. ODS25]
MSKEKSTSSKNKRVGRQRAASERRRPAPHGGMPVMELILAAMDPANSTAQRQGDSPTGRVVAAAAHADADENGTDRIFLLASGAATAATVLALALAEQAEQTVDGLLRELEAVAAQRGTKLNTVPVIRALLVDQSSGGEVLGATFARDQGEFFTLITELADFAATCIVLREARFGTPVAETLDDLDEMLKDFTEA